MNLIIKRLNGDQYNLSDYGQVLDFQIDSPSPRHRFEEIEGRDGHIDLGTDYSGRRMRATIYFKAPINSDYVAVRNLLFRIFASRENFYLIDDREPTKQWFVKCESEFSPEQLRPTAGSIDLVFISSSAYAASIESTLGLAIAQISGGKIQKYRHSTTSFEVLNASDVEINPRKKYLVIQYKGSSNNLQIKNLTTGDIWSYTGTTAAGDVIELNGIRSTKNGLSIFRNTNRKLISLAPGWNAFELIGASGTFEISFEFRFYTL